MFLSQHGSTSYSKKTQNQGKRLFSCIIYLETPYFSLFFFVFLMSEIENGFSMVLLLCIILFSRFIWQRPLLRFKNVGLGGGR